MAIIENTDQIETLLSSRKDDFLDVKNFDRALLKFDKSKVKFIQNCLAYFYHYREFYEYDKNSSWPITDDVSTLQIYDDWKFR